MSLTKVTNRVLATTKIVKTVVNTAIDLSSGNAQTIASFSLPDIEAGDIIEATL
jgi:hypothetical protein